MFDLATKNKLKGSYVTAFDLMAQPGSVEIAKPPHTVIPVNVGFRHAGATDTEVVNAYGMNAVIITFKAADITPAKFDELTVDGKRFTLDAVHPIHVNGDLLFFKAYAKGN